MILMFLIIIALRVYGIDYNSTSDFIIFSICGFSVVYLAYKIGLEEIRKNVNKDNLGREILLKREKYWKILFIIITVYLLCMLLVVIINW